MIVLSRLVMARVPIVAGGGDRPLWTYWHELLAFVFMPPTLVNIFTKLSEQVWTDVFLNLFPQNTSFYWTLININLMFGFCLY